MFRPPARWFESMFRRRRLEDELDEELKSCFEMVVDRFIARGRTSGEARRVARLEFEGLEQVKERVRDGMAGSSLQGFLQDARTPGGGCGDDLRSPGSPWSHWHWGSA